jgi:hypothetical protein
MLNSWALAAALNFAVRAALFYKVFEPLSVEMMKFVGLHHLPLAIVLIGAAHWSWTLHLFVENELTLTVLVMFAGYLAVSVAVIGARWKPGSRAAAMWNVAFGPSRGDLVLGDQFLGLSSRHLVRRGQGR